MGFLARIKNSPGGSRTIQTVASAGTIGISSDTSTVYLSGTTAISYMRTQNIHPGRIVRLIGLTGSRDIVNASVTTTPFAFHVGGGSEVTLSANDILEVVQLSTGAWLRLASTDN